MNKLFLLLSVLLFSLLSDAQITFQKTYGGSGRDTCMAFQQTSDSGFILTGFMEGVGLYTVRTDKAGDTLWTRATSSATWGGWGYGIIQSNDGGFVGTGVIGQTWADDLLVYKLSASGNLLWSRAMGGSQQDAGYSIQQTTDGGFVVAGQTYSTPDLFPDGYLVKLSSAGSIQWSQAYGTTGYEEGFYSVYQTTDGGYVMAGWQGQNPGGDALIVKTDGAGTVQWARNFGVTAWEEATCVKQTKDGGFIIAGNTWSEAHLIKMTGQGNLQWTKEFGASYGFNNRSVQQTSDDGFILGGYVYHPGGLDAYLLRTDSAGNLAWLKTYGGSDEESGTAVCQTLDGGFALAGCTRNVGWGYKDYYLVKADSNGNTGCYESKLSPSVSSPVLTFSVSAIQSYPLGSMSVPVLSSMSGGKSTWLCASVGVVENDDENSSVLIFPNPSSGIFTVSSGDLAGPFDVFDVLGGKVYSGRLTSGNSEIDLRAQPNGIYFFRLQRETGIAAKKKIIIQR